MLILQPYRAPLRVASRSVTLHADAGALTNNVAIMQFLAAWSVVVLQIFFLRLVCFSR